MTEENEKEDTDKILISSILESIGQKIEEKEKENRLSKIMSEDETNKDDEYFSEEIVFSDSSAKHSLSFLVSSSDILSEKTHEDTPRHINITCSMCHNDFVYFLKEGDEYYQLKLVGEGKYCQYCEDKCVDCEKKPKDPSNSLGACSACYKRHIEQEDEIMEEERIAGMKLLDELLGDENEIDNKQNTKAENSHEEEAIEVVDGDEDEEEDGDGDEEEDDESEEDDEDSEDKKNDVEKDEKKICHLLSKLYKKSNGNLESDGSGGPTNGELGSKGCRIISDALKLGINFCIF
jgi:hypothetical protein